MEHPFQLTLDEEFLPEDTIWMETDECRNAQRGDFELYDPGDHYTHLRFLVHARGNPGRRPSTSWMGISVRTN